MANLKMNPALCFRAADLIKFMSSNYDDNTLTQEIAAAISFRLYFEKVLEWDDYFIYFEPKEVKQTDLLKQIGSSLNFNELQDFISNNSEQNTPIDFSYVCKDVKPADVYPVQAKIFGIGLEPAKVTELLIEYFEKLQKKYSKAEATLLIHFRNRGTLNLDQLVDWLNSNDIPFREVVLITLNPNGGLKMCQLLPNGGNANCFSFTKEEMLNL